MKTITYKAVRDSQQTSASSPSELVGQPLPLPDEVIWDLPDTQEPPLVVTASLDEPPTLSRPDFGQAVPVPDPENTCPHCGSSRACWVYNPHSRRSQRGWVLQRRLICCPATDRLAALAPPHPAVLTLSQPELDRMFVQHAVRTQTFLTYDPDAQPKMAPVYRAVEQYAHRFDPDRTRRGVFIAGRVGIGKSHLIHALVNQARALGIPAISLPLLRLLDLTVPEPGETAEQREERLDRRRVLRQVPVLAIRDLGRLTLSAAEIQELCLLLGDREDRELLTHFTGTVTPAKYRRCPQWVRNPEVIVGLTRCIERLCALILTCDSQVAPYTAPLWRDPGSRWRARRSPEAP